MKLQLNKKKLKNLSKDTQILPDNLTPNIGGGIRFQIETVNCITCVCVPSDNCPPSHNCM